jgi:large subunit ribosomal protein L18
MDKTTQEAWLRRKWRIRKKVFGLAERPRVTVFRSGKNFSAQAIDDEMGVTLASISSESPGIKSKLKIGVNVRMEDARALGLAFAKILQENKISKIVFDRNGYAFHGQVKAFADGAREGGILF